MPTPRLAVVYGARLISRQKAQRRAVAKASREAARVGSLVRWLSNLPAMPKAEREWRINLLIGLDDRSLTGRIMGDPRYLRSALYLKEQNS